MIEKIEMKGSPMDLIQQATIVENTWQTIIKKSEKVLEKRKGEMSAAGGALPVTFGVDGDQIWEDMKNAATEDGVISIAGIEFTLDDLSNMGSFYRWLRDENGITLHCIDERLKDVSDHTSHEVHEHCGACAAVKTATNTDENYEDVLLKAIGQEVKQPIYEDLPNHASISVYVDLSNYGRVLNEQERIKMKQAQHELPFHASLPVDLIKKYCQIRGVEMSELVDTLIKWNVQIARNIINGDHNDNQNLSDQTLLIVDSRGVDQETAQELKRALASVIENQLEIS